MDRQEELTRRLDTASRLYYAGKDTGISDTEFDLLLHELQDMEKKSGVIYPNSPTQRVGADIQDGFKKGSHPSPMLTIENSYDDEGVVEWAEKLDYDGDYNASVKYDGVSLELHYHFGDFVQALTRGDKLVGDDVTENVRGILDIPMYIEHIRFVRDFYVRGEVLMPKSRLAELNAELEEQGLKPFANTRNACSGSLKQLDPKVTAKRGLIFRPWDCFYGKMEYVDALCGWIGSMGDKAGILRNYGFTIENGSEPITVKKEENLIEKVNEYKKHIDSLNLDYDYDGVVIKIDNCNTQREIGTKDTRAIEWGIARKWNEEYVVETTLANVEWQVGAKGHVTPVGKLEPVECAGVTITNVTLHNVDFIKELGLKKWYDVKITRSGGVIPHVIGCSYDIAMEANGIYPEIEIPEVCPVCGQPLIMDGKILKCVNPECPAIIKGQILNFCSKPCMDIQSVGEEVVNDLYSAGLVKSLKDFIRLGLDGDGYDGLFVALGKGYGEKKINNILNGIDNARRGNDWPKLLGSLSIPNVGKVMAREIAGHYRDIVSLSKATVENLCEIDGIAETTATGIVEWFKKNDDLVQELIQQEYNTGLPEAIIMIKKPLPLDGMSLCFSGKSCRFKGDGIEEFLEDNGAKCTHSVSKSLTYLIVGEKPGQSKVNKAMELGIEIIEEKDFYNKYGFYNNSIV